MLMALKPASYIVDGDERFNPVGAVWDYWKYKSSPFVTAISELGYGKDVFGRDVTIGEALANRVSPIIAQDVADAWGEEANIQAAAAALIVSGLGGSVQVAR